MRHVILRLFSYLFPWLDGDLQISVYKVPSSVPNRPVRTAGPWSPIVPSVPGGVGMDGRARRPSSPFPESLQGPAVNLQSCS